MPRDFSNVRGKLTGDRTMADVGKSHIGSREVQELSPAGEASALVATACPACGGSGRVLLLTSIRACRQCGGDGRAHAARERPGRTVEEADGTIYIYDGLGRLSQVVRPNAGNVRLISYE
jgi:DnaJ-class molecular chaperone